VSELNPFEIVQLLKRGSAEDVEAAIGCLVEMYGARLLRVSYDIVGPDDGEDVFWKFVEGLPETIQTFRWRSPREFYGWLRRCIQNAAITRYRSRASEVPVQDIDLFRQIDKVAPEMNQPTSSSQVGDVIATIKEQMTDLMRDALLMLEEGLSPSEFAEQRGIPPATARKRKERARKEFLRIAHNLNLMPLLFPGEGEISEGDNHG